MMELELLTALHERVISKIRGGMVIIGSLFWQDYKEMGKDTDRKVWRDENLVMENAIKIHYPLKYARISEKGETTMTVSGDNFKTGESYAYFVPFKSVEDEETGNILEPINWSEHRVNSDFLLKLVKKIVEDGKKAVATEGVKADVIEDGKGFSRSWLVLGRLLNNSHPLIDNSASMLRPKLDEAWSANMEGQDSAISDLRFSIYNQHRQPIGKKNSVSESKIKAGWNHRSPLDDIPIGNDGSLLTNPWLVAVDETQQAKLDEYLYALSCVLPPSFIASPDAKNLKKATVDLAYDKQRFYFFNNLACGIRTAEDYTSVLKNKEQDLGAAYKVSENYAFKGEVVVRCDSFELLPGQYLEARGEKSVSRLIFDTKGRLLFVFNDKLIWYSNKANCHHTKALLAGEGVVARFNGQNGQLAIFGRETEKGPELLLWSSRLSDTKDAPYFLTIRSDGGCYNENAKSYGAYYADTDRSGNLWKEYVQLGNIW